MLAHSALTSLRTTKDQTIAIRLSQSHSERQETRIQSLSSRLTDDTRRKHYLPERSRPRPRATRCRRSSAAMAAGNSGSLKVRSIVVGALPLRLAWGSSSAARSRTLRCRSASAAGRCSGTGRLGWSFRHSLCGTRRWCCSVSLGG